MNYAQIAKESRLKCLDLVFAAQTSHIGSLFSCADIMAVLSEKIDWDKDRFVLSAGWKAAMLYYHLWRKGRITQEELDSYCQNIPCPDCKGYEYGNFCHTCAEGVVPSKFIGLAEPITPDIKIAGGSMGMGLPGAVGLALAKKLKGEQGTVYCLMSDGELQCGTTWEASLIAAQHKLDNLVVVVDNNGLQAMGKTNDILPASKVVFSGFNHMVSDGNDFDSIYNGLQALSDRPVFYPGEDRVPSVLIANTIKGKGVSFMENQNIYHYKALSEDEYNLAKADLL